MQAQPISHGALRDFAFQALVEILQAVARLHAPFGVAPGWGNNRIAVPIHRQFQRRAFLAHKGQRIQEAKGIFLRLKPGENQNADCIGRLPGLWPAFGASAERRNGRETVQIDAVHDDAGARRKEGGQFRETRRLRMRIAHHDIRQAMQSVRHAVAPSVALDVVVQFLGDEDEISARPSRQFRQHVRSSQKGHDRVRAVPTDGAAHVQAQVPSRTRRDERNGNMGRRQGIGEEVLRPIPQHLHVVSFVFETQSQADQIPLRPPGIQFVNDQGNVKTGRH